jgi:hypothetical protein
MGRIFIGSTGNNGDGKNSTISEKLKDLVPIAKI